MDKFLCMRCKTEFVECDRCACMLNSALDMHDCVDLEDYDEGFTAEAPYFPCEEKNGGKCYLIPKL